MLTTEDIQTLIEAKKQVFITKEQFDQLQKNRLTEAENKPII